MELPTINVTDAQAQKLLEVFGTVAEYKAWLRSALRNEVERRTFQTAKNTANALVQDALNTVRQDMPEIFPVISPPE